MVETPLRPSLTASENVARPTPLGLTAPIPVTTTRRPLCDPAERCMVLRTVLSPQAVYQRDPDPPCFLRDGPSAGGSLRTFSPGQAGPEWRTFPRDVTPILRVHDRFDS